jgi:hypothetical protein
MKCQDLQLNLALYADNVLNANESSVLEAHLNECPLCRQSLADIQELRTGLRSLSRPEMPGAVLTSVQEAIRAEYGKRLPAISSDLREWLQMRMMPVGVGVLGSIALGLTFLWVVLSASNQIAQRAVSMNPAYAPSSILLTGGNPQIGVDADLTALEYARTRVAIAGESPSINPHGSLIALTKSFVQDDMGEDEVVVVADVFGNGRAQITEVVEPSQNSAAVGELEKALESEPGSTAFVPATLDQRSETIRVVLKIQSVDVSTRPTLPRRKML